MTVRIAIDVMGGDVGPAVTVTAALEFLRRHADASVLLAGLPDAINAELARLKSSSEAWGDRLSIQPASEAVTMDDAPAQAMRRKRDSSMHHAATLVKEQEGQAATLRG